MKDAYTQSAECAELERRWEIAHAKLGVAEELGWGVAGFAGLAAYLKWDSWLVGVAVAVVLYVVVTYRYRRQEAAADDLHSRAAGLGKYAGQSDVRNG